MNSGPVSSWPLQCEVATLRACAAKLPAVTVSPRDLARIELILGGYLSAQFEFALPLADLSRGDAVTLQDPEGAHCAILTVAELRSVDGGYAAQGQLQGVERPRHPLYETFRLDAAATHAQLSAHELRNWIAIPIRKILPREDWEFLRQQADASAAGLLLLVTDSLDRELSTDLRQRMAMAQVVRDELGAHRCPLMIAPDAADTDAAVGLAIDAQIAANLGCKYLAARTLEPMPEALDGVQILALNNQANPLAAEHQYPRILQALEALAPGPGQGGFCVFLTGLSGSGKSTIARHLEAHLLEHGTRQVSLLDGDIVRHHLSSELGFSKQHRDLNIRRIGYVASEIVKHRGISICAPIAPYAQTRAAVREMIEPHGAFIEVHVATPIEVCEARDRKGLYARARAGLITEFTGISDPYEVPQRPQLRLDTSATSCADCVAQIIQYLIRFDLWCAQLWAQRD